MIKKRLSGKFLPNPLLLALFLVLTVLSSYYLAFLERIYPGVKIAGMAVGNKTLSQADKALSQAIDALPAKIILIDSEKNWELDLEELGFGFQKEKALEKAYAVGRNPSLLKTWQEKKSAWRRKVNIPLEYGLNQELLEEKVKEIADNLFIPAVNPQVKLFKERLAGPGTRIMIEPGKNGRELDTRTLLAIIHQNLSQLNFEEVKLPIIQTSPALSEEETKNLKTRAEKFLDKEIKIIFENQTFTIDDQQAINFISAFGGFDQEKVKEYTDQLAKTIDRPPQNATFRFQPATRSDESGKVTVFKPAADGISLKKLETVKAIIQKLTLLEEESQKVQTLNLEVAKMPPKIKTEDVNSLGIKEMIGQGESYFKGSIASRIHNIELASSRLNGVLIGPDEVFSFNASLGEVSITTGYKEAYIIKEGRTVLGDGGGVCQVSTTLFRAALNAGLPIVERHAHAYRVGYYEQGSPPGLDATVFTPTADLKFKNNTLAYILVQVQVGKSKQLLNFTLYGTNDGRKVVIGEPRIWDQKPPPPPLYQEDPTLPQGAVKQVDWSAWGAKVAFDWKVIRGSEVLEERTFYSAYQPWQAVYLKGTRPVQ